MEYTVGEVLLELPAGTRSPGEEPVETAQRAGWTAVISHRGCPLKILEGRERAQVISVGIHGVQGEDGDHFRLSRTMLSKTLPREEVAKLLDEGKTGLIKGFVSKRTGRPFDAFLILKKGGKIGFEFPPRPAKKAAAKKVAKEG